MNINRIRLNKINNKIMKLSRIHSTTGILGEREPERQRQRQRETERENQLCLFIRPIVWIQESPSRQQTQQAKIESKQFFRGVNTAAGNEYPHLGTIAQVQQSRFHRHAMLGLSACIHFLCARASARAKCLRHDFLSDSREQVGCVVNGVRMWRRLVEAKTHSSGEIVME